MVEFNLEVKTPGAIIASIPVRIRFCGTENLRRTRTHAQKRFVYDNTDQKFIIGPDEYSKWMFSHVAICPVIKHRLMRSDYDEPMTQGWWNDVGTYRSRWVFLKNDLSVDGKYPVLFEGDKIVIRPQDLGRYVRY